VIPPASGPLGVNVAEHWADPPVPASVHGLVPLKLPGPSGKKPTVPDGVVGTPLKTKSVTVAVHVEGCSIFTVAGEQLTLKDVGCPTTVTDALPLLAAWVESPP
jgi:hypothetical protein